MKKLIFITALILGFTNAYGQISIGIQADIGKSQLYGISNEEIVRYGFSGAEYTQDIKTYLSPSLRLRKGISDRLFWESGIGYQPLSYTLHLSHFHRLFSHHFNETLDINLHYLSIPFSLGYSLPVLKRSKIITNFGLNTVFLLSGSDNFQEIIWEEIYFSPGFWYSQFVFKSLISISYQTPISQNERIEAGLFVSKDINTFVREEDAWGFYENLSSARNLNYGVHLTYFFTTK